MQASDSQTRATKRRAAARGLPGKAEAENQRAEAQTRQLEHERDSAANMQKDLESLAAKSTGAESSSRCRTCCLTSARRDCVAAAFDRSSGRWRAQKLPGTSRSGGGIHRQPGQRGCTTSKLSRRRADAVKDQLEAFGLPDRRVETRAYGEAFPVADNNTVEGRQQKRRVELVFFRRQRAVQPALAAGARCKRFLSTHRTGGAE